MDLQPTGNPGTISSEFVIEVATAERTFVLEGQARLATFIHGSVLLSPICQR